MRIGHRSRRDGQWMDNVAFGIRNQKKTCAHCAPIRWNIALSIPTGWRQNGTETRSLRYSILTLFHSMWFCYLYVAWQLGWHPCFLPWELKGRDIVQQNFWIQVVWSSKWPQGTFGVFGLHRRDAAVTPVPTLRLFVWEWGINYWTLLGNMVINHESSMRFPHVQTQDLWYQTWPALWFHWRENYLIHWLDSRPVL